MRAHVLSQIFYNVGSLTSRRVVINKGSETGPTVYRPYLEDFMKQSLH